MGRRLPQVPPGQPVPQFKLLESMNLPTDVQHKIFRKNAERLLKLA